MYVCVCVCGLWGVLYFTDVLHKGRHWIVFFPTTGRDERQINEELCTQTQCALLLLDDTIPPPPKQMEQCSLNLRRRFYYLLVFTFLKELKS